MGSVSGRLGSVFVSLRPFGVVYGARALGAGPRWRPRPWPAAPGPRSNAAPGAAGRRSGRAVGEAKAERSSLKGSGGGIRCLTSKHRLHYCVSNERRGKPAQLPALLRNESAVFAVEAEEGKEKSNQKETSAQLLERVFFCFSFTRTPGAMAAFQRCLVLLG